jgi:hypothetical protein
VRSNNSLNLLPVSGHFRMSVIVVDFVVLPVEELWGEALGATNVN